MDFAGQSTFLQCLVNLQRLTAKGLPGLRSDQLQTYYSVILKTDQPAAVPLGASAKVLRKMLTDSGSAFALADQDAHIVPLEAIEDDQPEQILDTPPSAEASYRFQ